MASVPLLWAQGFVIKGTTSERSRMPLILTIFDDSLSSREMKTVAYGSFSFFGSVKHPVLASISSTQMNGVLYFYLENSHISINLNLSNPAASPVVGSRTNSQFRYALEECSGAGADDCLRLFVENNPTSLFSPFVLYERLSTLPVETMSLLFDRLDGEARTTYHYHLLSQRIARSRTLTEGALLPDFSYVDRNGNETTFYRLRSADSCNIVIVGATWCASCRKAEQQVAEQWPAVRQQVVYIDRQPAKWDAPSLQSLVVDHVPFLLLTDAEGRIIGRDLRIWELSRYIQGTCPTPKSRAKKK
ncbi:MAG: DUF4369 domain-containing protein [Bacteroidales bacterium]|nr:DUF4369 domain-containing protein [Bacteroidales bacterium]